MTEIGERIKEAAKAVGGLNQLAKLLPLARRTLGDKISGKTELGIGLLVDISRITGYTVQWLATGDGPRTIAELPDPGAAILERGMLKDRLDEERMTVADVELVRQYGEKTLYTGQALDGLIHPDVLADISEVVKQAYKAAGITLPPRLEAQTVATHYNAFIREGIDLLDAEEIGARMVLMRKQLARELAVARNEPGTGKRSA